MISQKHYEPLVGAFSGQQAGCSMAVTHLLVPGGQVSPGCEVAAGSFSGR